MHEIPLEDLKELMQDDTFRYAITNFVHQHTQEEVRDTILSLEDKIYELEKLVDSVTSMYEHFKDDKQRFETLSEFNTMLKKLEESQG
jgi:hypothetical protein